MKRTLISWGIFATFFICAVTFNWHPDLFRFSMPAAPFKALIWVAFLSFLAYSVYCSRRENIFRSIASIGELHWGRQIGIDLYIGLSIFLSFVYVHEGSLLAVALWLVPVVLFANLAVLLYLAIHFESILALIQRSTS